MGAEVVFGIVGAVLRAVAAVFTGVVAAVTAWVSARLGARTERVESDREMITEAIKMLGSGEPREQRRRGAADPASGAPPTSLVDERPETEEE